MKNVIAIILIFVTIGLFYTYVGPTYQEIKTLQTEKAQYDEALTNSKKITASAEELLAKYNSFSPEDLGRLGKLLPDYVDNIRLIIEIDSLASKYNMVLKNVQISSPATPSESANVSNQALPGDITSYGGVDLSFDVSGSYGAYREFIKEIEHSLRILDVIEVSFVPQVLSSEDKQKTLSEFYIFKTVLKTYWLK
jgi:hypothetical protein